MAEPATKLFRLGALRKLGWSEERIRAALKAAPPGYWRCRPQRDVDWADPAIMIDVDADAATVPFSGALIEDLDEPVILSSSGGKWWERVEQIELLLPIDADGQPMDGPTPVAAPDPTPTKEPKGQLGRALRALKKVYPPDGKTPRGATYKAIAKALEVEFTADNKRIRRESPSIDVVTNAVKALGRSDD